MKLPVQWSPGDEQQEKLRYENEGKLFLYNEAIVYKATFTHGAELAFGLVGLAASHSKAKNSDALIFPMDQIVCIRDGMHRSKLPYMVIEMRDGEKHLFVPALTVSENLKFTKFKAFSERKQEFMELVRAAQSILQARRY